jgi:ABC-type transport system involved in multi-copper enzyme maturation permease subunit
MTTTAQALASQQTRTVHSAHPLLSVIAWELRRFRSSRSTRVVLPLTFAFFLLVIWLLWALRFGGMVSFGNGARFTVAITSAEGLVATLPVFSFLLTMILPFITTDGTARDLKRQAHELLMATPLPTWAYIWGRYLAGLLVSLGLAVVLLASLLLMGMILHQTQENYPLPQPEAMLSIWAVALAPTTILISSITFALGTMLQRNSNLVKIAVLISWFVCTLVLPSIPTAGSGRVPTWYLTWEPTNTGMSALLQAPYTQGFSTIFRSSSGESSDSAILAALTNLEQQMPDLGQWILPHLVWMGLGLALVVLAALTFKRFSNIPN